AKGIAIQLSSQSLHDKTLFDRFLQELTQTLAPELVSNNSAGPGASQAPVFISIEGEQEVCTLALGRAYAVTPSPDQLQRLSQLPGTRSAALIY
ncbi:MAG: hypothetical protein ACO3SN_09890, partial [Burkholderiaceae bacterium]